MCNLPRDLLTALRPSQHILPNNDVVARDGEALDIRVAGKDIRNDN